MSGALIYFIIPLNNQNRRHHDQRFIDKIRKHGSDHESGFTETHFVGNYAASNISGNISAVQLVFNAPVHPLKLMFIEAKSGLI